MIEKEVVHVQYRGDMTLPKRETAVRVFQSREKARIMLMSRACGGVGLNLTRGNREYHFCCQFCIISDGMSRRHLYGPRME